MGVGDRVEGWAKFTQDAGMPFHGQPVASEQCFGSVKHSVINPRYGVGQEMLVHEGLSGQEGGFAAVKLLFPFLQTAGHNT